MKKNDAPGDQGGIIIRRFMNVAGAQSFNAFLESRGFHTALVGDNDSAGLGMTSIASGGIKILVPKAQLAAAQLASEEYDVLMTKE